MNWIEVRSKKGASSYKSDMPWAAISIAVESNTWPVLRDNNRIGLLQLVFADTCHSDVFQYQMFDTSHAIQILEFANTYWDKIDSLLIHCEDGNSLASAVAAALACIHSDIQSKDWYFNNKSPNLLVYNGILMMHYDPDGLLR